jgi:NAD+ synthetase
VRVALAQIAPVVGAFDANVALIEAAYDRACKAGARLLLTPELGVCGYPPHDLIERPEIFERNDRAVDQLRKRTEGQECALIVGHVDANPYSTGRPARNCVSVLEGGKRVHHQAKTLLPTYDVFDEARYFEPAREVKPWICDGVPIAVSICEDLWGADSVWGRRLYGSDPVERYRAAGVKLILSSSASPYEWGKGRHREEIHAEVAKKLGSPLLYVNQWGATDEILFDGASFALDPAGQVQGRLPHFADGFATVDVVTNGTGNPTWTADAGVETGGELEVLSRALVTGIREYFSRTHFKMAVLGLSGGIDSAVVATLAAKALGPKNVLGVAMPSQYSSSHSLSDAELLAKNLGVKLEVRPIKFLFSTTNRELGEARGGLKPLAQENLQARLRGLTLMTLANHYGALTLTTGNKSELAVGYCTQYGDMVGALAPIGDLFKTRVYELARHLNAAWGAPIPEGSLTKPPSAELAPGQKDEDSLPPYALLDPLLSDYLEQRLSVAELVKRHESKHRPKDGSKTGSWVRDTLRLIEVNEFKRRQAAPVLKVSGKAFGIGRRIPLAKVWDQ